MTDVKMVMNRVFKINILFLIVIINYPLKAFSFELGSLGPGGGIVFDVDSSGSHGLEAKIADEGGGFIWGGAFAWGSVLTWNEAIAAAKAHRNGWRLPTKYELNLLYKQQTVVGGFSNVYYWSSSSEGESGTAWSQGFGRGDQSSDSKNYLFRVRAVRNF